MKTYTLSIQDSPEDPSIAEVLLVGSDELQPEDKYILKAFKVDISVLKMLNEAIG